MPLPPPQALRPMCSNRKQEQPPTGWRHECPSTPDLVWKLASTRGSRNSRHLTLLHSADGFTHRNAAAAGGSDAKMPSRSTQCVDSYGNKEVCCLDVTLHVRLWAVTHPRWVKHREEKTITSVCGSWRLKVRLWIWRQTALILSVYVRFHWV